MKVVASAIVDKYIGESARVIREMFGKDAWGGRRKPPRRGDNGHLTMQSPRLLPVFSDAHGQETVRRLCT